MTYRIQKKMLRGAAARVGDQGKARIGAAMGAVGALTLTPLLSEPASAQFPATSAGPDGGGYYYYTSSDASGPSFQWVDISSTGTGLEIGDDELSGIELGHNFPFYGCDFSDTTVQNNGGLLFGDGGEGYMDYNNPSFELSAEGIENIDALIEEGADPSACEFGEGEGTGASGEEGDGVPGYFDFPGIHVFNHDWDGNEWGDDDETWYQGFTTCPVASPNGSFPCTIVQWRDNHIQDNSGTGGGGELRGPLSTAINQAGNVADYQAVLFSNGDILLNYLDADVTAVAAPPGPPGPLAAVSAPAVPLAVGMPLAGGDTGEADFGADATIGIQAFYLDPNYATTPTKFLPYSVEQASLQNNFSILFTATPQAAPAPPPPPPPEVPLNNDVDFDSRSPIILPPAQAGEPWQYQVPPEIFRDQAGNPPAQVFATVSGGQELPEWLSYDPETGIFSGIPPFDDALAEALSQPLAFRINARLNVPVVLTAIYPNGSRSTLSLILGFVDNLQPAVGYWTADEDRDAVVVVEPREEDGLTFLAIGTFEEDGRPTWVTAFLALSDVGTFNGQLAGYTGGPTLYGPPRGPLEAFPTSDVSLLFEGTNFATLSGESSSLTIRPTALVAITVPPGSSPGDPEPGWWWDATRSGEGVFIENQLNNIRLTIFTYDETGQPIWVQGNGGKLGEGKFTIPMRRFQGPVGQVTVAEELGEATLSVGEGGTTAMLTLPNGDVRMLSRFSF